MSDTNNVEQFYFWLEQQKWLSKEMRDTITRRVQILILEAYQKGKEDAKT